LLRERAPIALMVEFVSRHPSVFYWRMRMRVDALPSSANPARPRRTDYLVDAMTNPVTWP